MEASATVRLKNEVYTMYITRPNSYNVERLALS